MSYFDIICDDVLSEIFQWLQAPDIPRINTVCKRWNQIINTKCVTVVPLTLRILRRSLDDSDYDSLAVKVHYVNGRPFGWTLGGEEGWLYYGRDCRYIREFININGKSIRREYKRTKSEPVTCWHEWIPYHVIEYTILSSGEIITELHPSHRDSLDIAEWDTPIRVMTDRSTVYYYTPEDVESRVYQWCYVEYERSPKGHLFVIERTLKGVTVYYKGSIVTTALWSDRNDSEIHEILLPENSNHIISRRVWEIHSFHYQLLLELLDTLVE